MLVASIILASIALILLNTTMANWIKNDFLENKINKLLNYQAQKNIHL